MDLARARISATFATDARASASAGLVATLSTVARQEGILALYRGVGLTLAGSFPYEGIKFGVYDALRAAAARRQPAEAGDGGGSGGMAAAALTKAYCGAAAAMVANLFMYPNDTLRRRMQMQGANGAATLSAPQVAMALLRAEGPAAFYRGVGATLLRAVPSTGIQFGAYEMAKSAGRSASAR
jgi:solute carrier family 25 phosphate transporter 23/24/25/41